MKEFYGRASFILNFNFGVKAKNIEEAKEKVLAVDGFDLQFLDFNKKETFEIVDISDWYIVDKVTDGNVRESAIRDFEIKEEK